MAKKVIAKKKAPAKTAAKKVVKKAVAKPAAKKVVAKKTAAKPAAKKVVTKKVVAKSAAKKVVVKKATAKLAAKKATATKVEAKTAPKKVTIAAKPSVKTVAPTKVSNKVASPIKTSVTAKKIAPKHSEKRINDNPQKETPKSLEKNDFLNLKIAKSMHENPPLYDYSEDDTVEHAPLTPIIRETPKVGRNEPCPCGSGMKYKKCHGNI